MKRSYIHMPLLIHWPRQPGNDIDVFPEPVIDELVEMFLKGVPDVWDEYKKEHVTIKGVLIATITDLPGRGSLSEENTKGYNRCVECLDDIDAVNLPNNSQIVYMGHHRFLPKDHPYRRNRKDFNGTIEKMLSSKISRWAYDTSRTQQTRGCPWEGGQCSSSA